MKNRQNPAKVAADKKTLAENFLRQSDLLRSKWHIFLPRSCSRQCQCRRIGHTARQQSADGGEIQLEKKPREHSNMRGDFSTEKDCEGGDASAQHPLPFASQLLQ